MPWKHSQKLRKVQFQPWVEEFLDKAYLFFFYKTHKVESENFVSLLGVVESYAKEPMCGFSMLQFGQ